MGVLLYEKNIALVQFPTMPANPEAVTVTEWDAAINHSCNVFKADTYLRPEASATINDPLLCGGLANAFGESAYAGQLAVARFFDAQGIPDEESDILWEAVKEKGSPLILGWRKGPRYDASGVAKQEYSLFEATTDNPGEPSDYSGYQKAIVPLAISQAWLNKRIVAA